MTVEYWFRCPNGHVGKIDHEQYQGDVSVICDTCNFHGYAEDGEVIAEFGESP